MNLLLVGSIALIILVNGGCGEAKEIARTRAERDALLNDKADLIQQTQRLRNEVVDLAQKLTEANSYNLFLKDYSLPGDERLGRNKYEIVALNNPLLHSQSQVRAIKKQAVEIQDLWEKLEPFARSFKHFDDDRDLAIGAMLVVGAFYDYGNPAPDDMKPGCVSNGMERDFIPIDRLTFALHMQSDIGCCTDFAMMLGSFLRHLAYDCKILVSAAHQALQVRLGGEWCLLDANTNIFVANYFADVPKSVYYFPVYRRSRTFAFQDFLIKSLVFENEPYRERDWEILELNEHSGYFGADYLIRK